MVSLEYLERAFRQALALRPDVICLTGDFVTRRDEIPAGYADVLRQLSAAAPTFASLGNHDGGAWTAHYGGLTSTAEVRAVLTNANIQCLHNANALISVHGRALRLVGVGDLWSTECRPEQVFPALKNETSARRVVLCHNPDAKEFLAPFPWDLVLCGHTHGGQVGVPILARHFAPVSDKRYLAGLHRWQGRHLFVNRGVGSLFGVRFNCRPEIALIELS